MKKLLVAVCLLSPAALMAMDVLYVTNAAGGQTMLTELDCPVSDGYKYGLGTTSDGPPMSFCWKVEGDKAVLYMPLNKTIKLYLKVFKKMKTEPTRTPEQQKLYDHSEDLTKVDLHTTM